ncbi:hypothetical protein [Haloarcula sp. K1]|uniref:hypothetical protein n=1 Tax=Haloarcula sp. K1 TaxID=1622207 RepID=UPI0007BB6EE4|nr:hypothetical protein [Haloarcula sp. K1]KZX49536.1 hypothetical protein AV929_17630 [Haloarcula sp. K1]
MIGKKSASWMNQIDERIMEWIRENGFASPSILSRERGFDVSSGYIRDRCRWLQYAGLLAPVSGDLYDLTSEGILYLKGELDASHCPRPTPSKVFEDRYATPPDWVEARGRFRVHL